MVLIGIGGEQGWYTRFPPCNVARVRVQAWMSYLGWGRSFQLNNCFNNLQKFQFDFTLGLPYLHLGASYEHVFLLNILIIEKKTIKMIRFAIVQLSMFFLISL